VKRMQLSAEMGVVLLATGAVLACTLVIRRGQSRAANLSDDLASVAPSDSRHAYRAFLVFQLVDCQSRVGSIVPLIKGANPGEIGLTGLLLDSSDREYVARVFRRNGMTFPVATAPASLQPAIRSLGYGSTPLVIILDQEDRVRLTLPFPEQSGDQDVERRMLSALSEAR